VRLGLAEFNHQVRDHVDDVISTQDALQYLKTLFSSGDEVRPACGDEVIECLSHICECIRGFLAFIERSNHLPLAVFPLRLPLIMTLKDLEAHNAKLNRLLNVPHDVDEGLIPLNQPVEQLFDIKHELGVMQAECNKVLDQVGILLDRARFKERQYSTAQNKKYSRKLKILNFDNTTPTKRTHRPIGLSLVKYPVKMS
jgi:hypothetical protein